MRSTLPPAPTRRSILLLPPLAALLSACAPRIVVPPPAIRCAALMQASGLLGPTSPAPIPSDDRAGSWIVFGDTQTGQLDRANADKGAAAALLEECERQQDLATSKAPKR